ncbi:MAG: phosphoribosylformylglycinamidine cyclo-ligase, partial [Planctomycetota bacterium]
PSITASIVEGVARGCEIAGCALLGGECAEMPDIYAEGDFDLAGFSLGVVELKRAIDPARMEPGDQIIGLASDGVHSNGYTLVRAIVGDRGLDLNGPMPGGDGRTLGEELLTPTRIYARPIVRVLRNYRVKHVVSGMAHITGGGLPGNVCRTLPADVDAVIRKDAWEVPPIFRYLQQQGDVADEEMWRVFNMGIGYVLIVRPSFVNAVLRRLGRLGERAVVLGEVVRGSGAVKLV